jgi:DNA modification methylase
LVRKIPDFYLPKGRKLFFKNNKNSYPMQNIFQHFDFKTLESPDFKEDSVREVLILPILAALGYNNTHIVRSKSLKHPFVNIGSQKRAINVVPDYLLRIADSYAWVLDAKAPNENIKTGSNVEQVYSYAIHPEVRTKFFALCNGHAFSVFRQDANEPMLYFELKDIAQYWEMLSNLLSSDSFQNGKTYTHKTVKKANRNKDFDYLDRPLLEELPVQKQSAKRHFGVHGYFTKQSWNIVQEYIKNFSQEGDIVLDPFGGSGVTAIESFICERKGIHIDLNPMSPFIVNALLLPINNGEIKDAFEKVKKDFEKLKPSTEEMIESALKKYPYPKNILLPKGSDVKRIEELFTDTQLAQLALLKFLIKKHTKKDTNTLNSLMLAFSSSLNKFNLTFHYTPKKTKDKMTNEIINIDESKSGGGGDSGIFRYYRYRIAPEPPVQDLMVIFEKKVSNVIAAKKEIAILTNKEMFDRSNIEPQIVKGTATDLSFIKKETVDYIYTDPPYGKKIPYLDLSTMWNAWLDLEVTQDDFDQEAIEGGEQQKTKTEYNDLMVKSIEEMYRVLKFDRWMSFVFAHKDPEFWHLIIETAERCGFEYAGAVAQKNGQTSFKKRQNPFTVLAGQLIINFKKVRKPKYIMKASLGMDIGEIVLQTIEGVIAKNNGATLEQINDELIIKGLELGFLDLLKKEYSDLTPILLDLFDYDDKTEVFSIRKNTKFKTHVDLNLRVRYYLISYMRRMELQKKTSTFDEIVLYIIPLLKNGVTPENQTVLNVLDDIGIRVGENEWKLKKDQGAQLTMNL